MALKFKKMTVEKVNYKLTKGKASDSLYVREVRADVSGSGLLEWSSGVSKNEAHRLQIIFDYMEDEAEKRYQVRKRQGRNRCVNRIYAVCNFTENQIDVWAKREDFLDGKKPVFKICKEVDNG
jgi:hypothetical protein